MVCHNLLDKTLQADLFNLHIFLKRLKTRIEEHDIESSLDFIHFLANAPLIKLAIFLQEQIDDGNWRFHLMHPLIHELELPMLGGI